MAPKILEMDNIRLKVVFGICIQIFKNTVVNFINLIVKMIFVSFLHNKEMIQSNKSDQAFSGQISCLKAKAKLQLGVTKSTSCEFRTKSCR